MSADKFVPNIKGFIELRNEDFIQSVCLKKAREVASVAGGACGRSFSCDVQPGRTRCHARASCDVGGSVSKADYYQGAYSDIADAAGNAAAAVGGEKTWTRKRKKKK